jgi:hypothetical protein
VKSKESKVQGLGDLCVLCGNNSFSLVAPPAALEYLFARAIAAAGVALEEYQLAASREILSLDTDTQTAQAAERAHARGAAPLPPARAAPRDSAPAARRGTSASAPTFKKAEGCRLKAESRNAKRRGRK